MYLYKILNEQERHHGVQYKTGLNRDPRRFSPSGDCEGGGMYFAKEDILAFLNYGPWIRQVTLLKQSQVYRNPGLPKKWKTDVFLLGERRWIDLQVIRELVDQGANIHVENDYALTWAAKNGYLDIVKYLVSKGADVNCSAILHAARQGHLSIVTYLIECGVTSALKAKALGWVNSGSISPQMKLQMVKYLVEQGADIHLEAEWALRDAAADGLLHIVKYLHSCGADLHANQEGALENAIFHNHLDVVKYLIEQGAVVSQVLHNPNLTIPPGIVQYLTSIERRTNET